MKESDSVRDAYHDGLARALVQSGVYETKDGCVFYVLRVDPGSFPGEFRVGRRPAQVKTLLLTAEPSLGYKPGTCSWIQGMTLEWLKPERIA